MHQPTPSTAGRIASVRHTARLAAVFLAIGAGGVCSRILAGPVDPVPTGAAPVNLSFLYSTLAATEWLLFRGVRAGLVSTGTDWRSLVGPPSRGLAVVPLTDVTLGLLGR
ncbi:MAG: hypothetical protein ABJC89_12770 [Acidobacteriota bacterium]